ncbi:general transcription factor II-I repeat domain-containing protein 2-like [Frankliniella occidentalis]|uniref:General transcription factor II-I repeat domain-containing protein 2-like n=1 Tax=Frankliniella occidentalis TaxID=133901 RepID=A0A9C6X950_FRAOC|nr:general transcription factor II-I repeat domain-containing protein 2-like [Frankliniella occidentalis]
MADRADDIARDLASQLRHKCATFSHSTLALDKSTDSSDMAKLTIFERGTDEDMGVLEELLDLYRLEWNKYVGLATDGCPSVCGDKKYGLVARQRVHLKSLGLPSDFPHFYCIIHQEALCAKSFSADEVMNVVKAVNKIRAQGLNHRQFRALLEEVGGEYEDIPYYSKVRWLSRAKGKGHVISDMMQAVQGFEMRLSLFEEQLRKGELFHFESLKPLSTPFTQVDQNKYVNTAKKMRIEFADNSQDVRKMQTGISLIIVPFPMPLREVPLPLQNEVIDLRCDKVLEVRFQSRLTDKHLIGQLRVMARSSLQPDFNNLILEKNAQVSPTD